MKLNLYKSLTFFSILFSSFFVLNGCEPDSETDSNNDDSTSTEETVLPETYSVQEYDLPEELNYNQQQGDFLYDTFFPIGWSRDGVFAYIVEAVDEGAGFYQFEFRIQDMGTDKILWSWKPQESEEGDLLTTWETNYELFKSYLNEYQIYQNVTSELGKTSFTYKNDSYQIELETKLQENADYGFDVVTETYISLHSQKLGEKMVFAYIEKDYSMVLSVIVTGIIQSPYSEHVAILTRYETWGYEGPPNVVYFELSYLVP